MVKSKGFFDLILLHAKNPVKAKSLLQKDRRLNQDERNIIRGFMLVRDNQNAKAMELAAMIKKQSDPLVESMRFYLEGMAANNLGYYQRALNRFQDSHLLFPKEVNPHMNFVILNNIYLIHSNLHQVKEAREILAVMQTVSGLPELDLLRLKILQFGFHIVTENKKAAEAMFEPLQKMLPQCSDYDQSSLVTQFFKFGVVFQRYDVAQQAILDLRRYKKYALTQIFNYMKVLFAHLKNGDPIYIFEKDFQDYPTMLAELRFIRALDQNKMQDASKYWKELQLINPDIYLDDYVYEGYPSVFSKCFQRHQHKLAHSEVRSVREPNLSVLDAIELKLRNEETVSKEQLFYYVYGRELEGKNDQNSISKSVNKLKTTKNLKIRSIRGAYQLIKKAS